MKKINFQSVYAIVCGVLIFTIVIFGASCAKAQTQPQHTLSIQNEIAVKFSIYLDDVLQERDDIVYSIYNVTKSTNNCVFVSQEFTTFFTYDRTYQIEVGCSGYNYRRLGILTACPKREYNLNLNIYLYSDRPNDDMGLLAYNKKEGDFTYYKPKE